MTTGAGQEVRVRFIATADWQLGMTAHYLSDEARPRFHRARLDAVRRIGELATRQGAQFVLVCGDVFESNQLNRAIVSRTFEVLREFSVPVVLLPGNHDPLDAASIYNSTAFTGRVPEQVHVLRDSEPYAVVPGVEIVGAPWHSKRPTADLVAQACQPLQPTGPGLIRVIAGHGAVSSLSPDTTSAATIDTDALIDVMDQGKAQAVILGDRHSTTEVAQGIWYPGAPEVTARRERDPGNVLVIDIDEQSGTVSVDKVHVGSWTFMTITERVDSAEDVSRLEEAISALPDKDRTAVWLALTGTLGTAAKATLDDLLADSADLFARFDYWDRHTDIAVVPDDADFADLPLSGFARAAVAELVERAGATRGGEAASGGDGESRGEDQDQDEDQDEDRDHAAVAPEDSPRDDAAVAQDALGLLYRFAGGVQ